MAVAAGGVRMHRRRRMCDTPMMRADGGRRVRDAGSWNCASKPRHAVAATSALRLRLRGLWLDDIAAEQMHAFTQLHERRGDGLRFAFHAQIDGTARVDAPPPRVAYARQAEYSHTRKVVLDLLHQRRQRRLG